MIHSGWILSLDVTFAHFAISKRMNAANSSGVLPVTSAPWAATLLRKSGVFSTA